MRTYQQRPASGKRDLIYGKRDLIYGKRDLLEIVAYLSEEQHIREQRVDSKLLRDHGHELYNAVLCYSPNLRMRVCT